MSHGFKVTRRWFLRLAMAVVAWRAAPAVSPDEDGIIEVNGWILRRSDLA